MQIQENNSAAKKDNATRDMLNKYLQGAVALSSGQTWEETINTLNGYNEKKEFQALKDSPNALDAIKDKEKELKAQGAKYDMRTKANVSLDADSAFERTDRVIAFGVATIAAQAMAPVVANDPNALAITMVSALGMMAVSKGVGIAAAHIVKSKTPEQKKKVAEYTDIKHAQFALKMLKKELEAGKDSEYAAEVGKLYAQYGNPSGGMTHKDPIEAKSAPAKDMAEPKAAKKSYMDEVAEMYARFGGPSGGMVHDDKIEAKSAPAKDMAEPKAAKKSYMDEVAEMYARFGGPSGGMVHDDKVEAKSAPAKDMAEPKAEKKSSYMDEVGKLFAAGYGQPSGGLVQAPTEKVDVKVAEPKAETKSSYWQQVKETFARFGGPSGGFLHSEPVAQKDNSKVVAAAMAKRKLTR